MTNKEAMEQPLVFVSHASEDAAVAQTVCVALEAQGIPCWIAPRDIPPGETWMSAIMGAIGGVRAMLLLYTGRSNDSVHVLRELERALNRRVPLVPVLLEQVPMNPSVELLLATCQWLDATEPPLERHLDRLCRRLAEIVEAPVSGGLPGNPRTSHGVSLPKTRDGGGPPASRTLTFLFTDIEGSTRLWEDHPEAMREALKLHDALLRDCIEAHGGRVFKTIGDAFCAAFVDPRGGLEAALVAQQRLPALAVTTLKESRPLKVRMALHTGVAEERDGDYFGQPLNRLARLLATGHGGQVLLSLATAELVRDNLPASAELRGLGEHRLKDLGRPESLFQLLHPELLEVSTPLRSLNNPALKHNLPQQVTSFIGREAQIAEIKATLVKTRLLTLTGNGGNGKTRLAVQVAADLLDGSGDGVWLVELAPLTDPNLVTSTVAHVLELKEKPGQPLLQTLTEHLRNQQLLLLLDNCEHLLTACAKLADAILRQCPQVQILATSREGLGISGERTYRVPSLSVPDPRRDATPERLGQFAAVRLFVERADLAKSGFEVTRENAAALASICHRLDGIPMALELAAARVRSLSVEEINQKLDQRFRLLTGGSRTALPRQQTLRSLIDWSYDLLNPAEQALLCRLSVFPGEWTLEAAEQVCAGDPVEEWETLDLLTSLGDKSLVVAEQQAGSTRYRLLETVRQYSRDRLLETGDSESWRDRHLAHFLALAEEAEPQLRGADQQAWMERLEAEHDNLRAALDWAAERGGEAPAGEEAGLRLAGAIWWFWCMRGYLQEGRERLSQALAATWGGASKARAKSLIGAGVLAYSQGDYSASRPLFEEALELFRELGDRRGVASVLNNLANLAQHLGGYAAARTLYAESLAIYRELGDRGASAVALGNLGAVTQHQGDYAAARTLLEESLAIRRELGDQWGITIALYNLGIVAQHQDDHVAARELLEESLTISRELGNRVGIAYCLEALSVFSRPPDAARVWGAAERLREEVGAPLSPGERPRYAKKVASARSTLRDDPAFDAAWAEGRALTLEEAIGLALESPNS